MKIEHPQAYRFILEDEVYLLNADKRSTTQKPANEPVTATPVKAVAPIAVETPETVFNYLGKNNKNFLVLVNYESDEFIDPAHLTALENILLRKELHIADVAIFNINKFAAAGFNELNDYFKPQKIVILGKEAMPNGMQELAVNQTKTLNGIEILYSLSFGEMMSSNDNKRAFWDQMKKL